MWVIFLANCLRKRLLIGERCFCYIRSTRSVGIKKSIKFITRENDLEIENNKRSMLMEVKIYTKDKIIHFFNPLHIIYFALNILFISRAFPRFAYI